MVKNDVGRGRHGELVVMLVLFATVIAGVVAWSMKTAAASYVGFVLIPCILLAALVTAAFALAAGVASCFDRRAETRAWLDEQRRR
jgi:hypothetical protein